MKYLDYKGYYGSIEYSREDQLLYGKVLGLRSLLSYEGLSGVELEADFKTVVDEYLSDCSIRGIEPEKAFKGSFNIRISPDLHREAALTAMNSGTSLNNFVKESIRIRIESMKLLKTAT